MAMNLMTDKIKMYMNSSNFLAADESTEGHLIFNKMNYKAMNCLMSFAHNDSRYNMREKEIAKEIREST